MNAKKAHIIIKDLTMAYGSFVVQRDLPFTINRADVFVARLLDELILELRVSLGAMVVVVTHELASIFTIGNNSVFLDAEAKTMIAAGDPKVLRDDASNPKVRTFLTRGEA
jgi:ABC-type transporter Mla maintaining outer membrane lipid asymmetry ATPase subunit MlaF